jgi:SAM-dependent methyltransferase
MCKNSLLSLLICAPVLLTGTDPLAAEPEPLAGHYEAREASRDGTGRFYMGREIARVMGHLAAGWLERPTREQEERTDLLLHMLDPAPDAVVADLGAGTGYFSFPLAQRVTHGRVIAVDIQPEMLAIIERRKAVENVTNVDTLLAGECDPGLPNGAVDLVLMVDAYHEFSCPREVMLNVARALAPDGRVVLVEYRGEDPDVPIKRLHKMSVAQATREMAAAGLELVSVSGRLPLQHVMTFRRSQ